MERVPRLEAIARHHAHRLRMSAVAARLTVYWNPRLKSAAGQADLVTFRIDLNPGLPARGVPAILRILLHELAHLIAVQRAPTCRHHGPEWKQACTDLGIPGERVYSTLFKVTKLPKPHAYACNHCGLLIRRVRRVKGPIACIKCCRKHNRGKYAPKFRFVNLPAAEDGDD